MFSFFRRKTVGKPVLIADVESGSVAVAAALIGLQRIEILASERAFLPLDERESGRGQTAISLLLDEVTGRVVETYAKSDFGKVSGPLQALHCVIGAPWVTSHTASARSRFSSPRVVTDSVIKDHAKEALRQPLEPRDAQVLESNVTRVQLNGYATARPLGKYASDIVVTAFQSHIDPSVRQGIEDALGKHLPDRARFLRSHTRAVLTVLRERADTEHFTVIAMNADMTNCIAVHKEALAREAHVSEGSSTVIRRATGQSGLPEETLSLMRMVSADACSTSACEELKQSIAKIEPELVRIFGEAFGALAAERRLPNTCFVSAHADIAPWLERFLARLDFSPFTITMRPFTVESLTPEHVREFVSWGAGAREDAGIALAASFVNITQSP